MARAQSSPLQLLGCATRSIDELLSSLGEPLDLTDFDILCALRTRKLYPEELATLSETQLPDLLRAIRRLVAENLVRVQAGEVSLTARGERLRADTVPLIEEAERNLLAVLPSGRREHFARELGCIVQKLSSTPRAPKPR